ncbi:ammonia-forming cytochrome c nitrite reductase [Sansalvadorimonas sp. 2012CJ34-2]|uniref:nitrite reductase (cytochrome; ammonia-forming) n=1 Tax=Parendozoicomonas callyspongiae TaxID=2942213 RepID=A0ABT0PK97_9GAMM|nr:ammonia-forming cytochrome c nitrite reductase [Sansalvadorimonas sp. 2012CJ34-2]MCL6271666.1 ammonia-forming cytochrome c nitrite reductase [Sansalvadorimonas sp. 2012CJ34-2]
MNHCRALIPGVMATLLTSSTVSAEIGPLEARNRMFEDEFPRQYETWKQTAEMDFKSKHLGNVMEDALESDPRLVVLWAGYGFSKDYNAPRGHMHAVTDVRNTLRTGAPMKPTDGPMPNACWTCKSTDDTRLLAKEGNNFFKGKWFSKGSEIVNPIGCIDCHDPGKDMTLRAGRPHLYEALKASGQDPSKLTQHDWRTMVCAQCHVEYYFAGKDKIVTLPWDNGTLAEEVEVYYDNRNFKDWTHKLSKAPMLKAQHPGYEMWKEGVHGRNNVSCAACHMPQRRDKGVTFTDHRVVSPLRDIQASCKTCHSQSEKYLLEVTYARQDQVKQLRIKTEDMLVRAHVEAKAAWDAGASDKEMEKVLMLIRHAQWRWDYAVASHGASFHAPEEVLRVLGSSLDQSGKARTELARILARYGITKEIPMPDITTKEKAQAYIGLDMEKLKADKEKFKKEILPKWDAEAKAKGLL